MTHNVGFELENPVSEEGLSAVRKIGEVWRVWAPFSEHKIHPLRLECREVLPAASFARKRDAGTLVCFSGGVDATFAALQKHRVEAPRTALLIHGIDYRIADREGFEARSATVNAMANKLRLPLRRMGTDLRDLHIKHIAFYTLLLAMCLHYRADEFSAGIFAADYTDVEEPVPFPHGNCRVIAELMSTPNFAIDRLGAEKTRTAKLKDIAAHGDDLVRLVRVCRQRTKSGLDCGVCEKCTRQRLGLMAAGVSPEGMFERLPDLDATLFGAVAGKAAKSRRSARATYLFMVDVHDHLPKGAARDAVARLLGEMNVQ
jgi:hypothetical protein